MTISDALRDSGFTVIEAFNADEAVRILNSGVSIELMLSDVRMPGTIDGLALLDYSQAKFPMLPVIITSGHLLPDDALAKGAKHFVGKPYLSEDVITLVQSQLAKSQ